MTKYAYNDAGLVTRMERLDGSETLTSLVVAYDGSRRPVSTSVTGKTERVVKRTYDKFDRVIKIEYAKNEIETFSYDKWGRISEHTRGERKSTYQYDHFGRIAEKTDGKNVYAYSYNQYGQRVSLTVKNDKGNVLTEKRIYDRFGRLLEIFSFGKSVKYFYDVKGRVSRQVIDGTPIDYEYTKHGFLAGKYLGGRKEPISSVVYEYSKSGRIVARSVNGKRTAYEYDGRNQLLAVKDSDGNDIERYFYDKAGNMLKKTVNGKTTTFTFDGANQLVLSTVDGVTTRYTYDAAGRLVKEGNKTYRYGYLDKVMSVSDGKQKLTYDYHADGQIASANYGNGKTEDFLWDGLALVHRGGEHFINEPHIGGGNPVVSSKGTSYFNDMLGTTLGTKEKGCKYSAAALSAFGERLDNVDSTSPTIRSLGEGWFTGKPYVEGLGHAFLMRNYRASLGKWLTADPIGYPDGWNQLAYCGNGVVSSVDIYGAERFDRAWRVILSHWLGGSGDELDLFHDGYFSDYMNANALLNNSIRSWLLTYAYGHSAGLINMRRHAEIENGYYTGYELLHGSNGEVGDFEMWGGFTTERQGDYLLYHFNITCQWNDKIDPNYSYNSDADLETFIRLFGFPFPYFSPADYVIRIRWNKKLTIKVLYE